MTLRTLQVGRTGSSTHPDPRAATNREVGRGIGFDLFLYGRREGVDTLPEAIGEGFADARGRGIARRAADRYVRKWLQLRLNAFRRNRIVADEVTPEFIEQIDVSTCPVTRIELTHGEQLPSDWSVDRLNNAGAYAVNNLAIMSTAANKAKGDRGFDEVLQLSKTSLPACGLAPAEWLRLASIMLGPCSVDHPGRAPIIPLVAPIPARTASPAAQIVQYAFTRRAGTRSGANALVRQFAGVCLDAASNAALARFVETMHRGLKNVEVAWDVWLLDGVLTEFVAWRWSLPPRNWAMAGSLALRIVAAHRIDDGRLARWCLSEGGRVN